jgi:8-oxo-dGTP pyrophosphatase MutT (NUDIX family)
MQKLISVKENVEWFQKDNQISLYTSDALPERSLITAVASFIKDEEGNYIFACFKKEARKHESIDLVAGHIEKDETIEDAVIREAREEAFVEVAINRPLGFMEINLTSPKVEGYKYPYPKSYIAIFLCDLVSLNEFEENKETSVRICLTKQDFSQVHWCKQNPDFIQEVF